MYAWDAITKIKRSDMVMVSDHFIRKTIVSDSESNTKPVVMYEMNIAP